MTQTDSVSTLARRMNNGLQTKRRLFSIAAIALICLFLLVPYKLFTVHLALYRPVDCVLKPDGWSTDSWEFVYVDMSLTKTQADQICKTLEKYNEFHFRVFNLVFISRQLYNNPELLWNYTGKSQVLN